MSALRVSSVLKVPRQALYRTVLEAFSALITLGINMSILAPVGLILLQEITSTKQVTVMFALVEVIAEREAILR
jgi:hypothetical protein